MRRRKQARWQRSFFEILPKPPPPPPPEAPLGETTTAETDGGDAIPCPRCSWRVQLRPQGSLYQAWLDCPRCDWIGIAIRDRPERAWRVVPTGRCRVCGSVTRACSPQAPLCLHCACFPLPEG